jgi:hypothetical protein
MVAVFVTGDGIDRELREIAENLHRNELTALERDTQVARWIELVSAKKVSGQSAAKIDRERVDPEGGNKQPLANWVSRIRMRGAPSRSPHYRRRPSRPPTEAALPDIGRATATTCFGIADAPPTTAKKKTTWRHAGRDGRH